MRKSILGIFLFLAVAVMAGQRTPEQAAEIAAQFTNQQPQLRRMHASERQAANLKLAHKALQNNSQDAAFYVFNQEGNNGFIIISADDRTAEDVLGYTDKGSFDADHINPNLAFWLSRYTEEITGLQTLDESELANIRKARKTTKVTAITPLLKNAAGKEITWYQEAPYYNYCPIDKLDNTRSLTGCVATATSAVMYKWRHPAKGHGTHSYTWYDWKDVNYTDYWTIPMSANFDTVTFKWDDMLPAYIGKNATPAQKKAVASLMFNVGVAANMQYGGEEIGGSGAWTDDMAYGLQTYFDYTFDKFITMYSKTKYENNVKGSSVPNISAEFGVTKDQIMNYFNADLEAGRPIVMGGEGSAGGHEFVCDGRDTENKFHINFGWEGDGNGYYTLSALGPNGAQFSSNLDAIIGLRPATTPVDPFEITWMANGAQFTTTQSTGTVVLPTTNPAACEGKVFVGWTATANYSSATTAPTFVKAGDAVEEGAIFYAVFAEQSGQGTAEVTDVLTRATTGVTGTSYSAWSNKTVTSSAVYAGQSAGGNESIQLRSNNSNSGIVTTSTGGKITKITVDWNSNTDNARTLDIYGKNSAYSTPSDLYDNSTKGTKLGSIKKENGNELTITGDYTYVGVRSNSGALYMNSISFTWASGSAATYSNYSTTCGGGTDVENTVVAPKAVKVIDKGQVVILREGAKYNVLGQPIQ